MSFVREDALDAAYRFLVTGFKAGAAVTYMRTEPSVMRIKDIRRRVINEARYFRNLRGLILLMERYMYVTLNRRAM